MHPNYLSTTLRKTAREQGSDGLVKAMGRPVKLSPTQLRQAQRWVKQGLTGQEIARRLQVSDTMISQLVGGRRSPEPVQDELPNTEQSGPVVDGISESGGVPRPLGHHHTINAFRNSQGWRA